MVTVRVVKFSAKASHCLLKGQRSSRTVRIAGLVAVFHHGKGANRSREGRVINPRIPGEQDMTLGLIQSEVKRSEVKDMIIIYTRSAFFF